MPVSIMVARARDGQAAARRRLCLRARRSNAIPCAASKGSGAGAAILSWAAVLCATAAALALLGAEDVRADFIYVDFNDTTGLLFNQNSTTTSCDDSSWVRGPTASGSRVLCPPGRTLLLPGPARRGRHHRARLAPATHACACCRSLRLQYPYAHSPEHDHGYNDRNDNGEAVPLMMVRPGAACAAACPNPVRVP